MMTERDIDRMATNFGKAFLSAAKEMQMENDKVYFVGSVYEVRVRNEGTSREKLIITRDGWNKPLVLGGVGDGRDCVDVKK